VSWKVDPQPRKLGRVTVGLARAWCFFAVLVAAVNVAATAAAQTVVPANLPPLDADPDSPAGIPPAARPTWRGALEDSVRLLAVEHSIRIGFQAKTRRELGGPFFKDYARSVRMPQTWGDGDSPFVNYIGHPIHGAAAGFVWLDHEDGAHDPDLGFSRAYWASRGRAAAWAAGYSLQFEFGPLSEASIGNVGLRAETTGWVDHVVTPAGAFGLLVAEDALDRYLVRRIEGWTSSPALRATVRIALNPSRALSNSVQGRMPWSRPTRPLR
jgi:hypothetical protein